MEAPLCPLCNTKHFAREPHIFKEKVVEVTKTVTVTPAAGFDRRAYQRELMRRRRANRQS